MKKIDKEIKGKIRALYLTSGISLKELAQEFGIKETTVYAWSKKEHWVFLKKNYDEESLIDVLGCEVDLINKSIDYWNSIKKYCKRMVDADAKGKPIKKFYKGKVYEVVCNLEKSEAKALAETYIMADERVLLLKSVKLKGEEIGEKE